MRPLRPGGRRHALASLQAVVTPPARPNPIVLIWRWRYELALAAGATLAGIAIARLPATGWLLAGVVVLIAITVLYPPVRRAVMAEAWCVITPHRVRAGCVGAGIHSRRGRLPAVILTTRKP